MPLFHPGSVTSLGKASRLACSDRQYGQVHACWSRLRTGGRILVAKIGLVQMVDMTDESGVSGGL